MEYEQHLTGKNIITISINRLKKKETNFHSEKEEEGGGSPPKNK